MSEYYRQVEYIEGTGVQYINTLYKPSLTVGYKMYTTTGSFTTNPAPSACQNNSYKFGFIIGLSSESRRIYYGNSSWQTTGISASVNSNIMLEYNYLNSQVAKVNDNSWNLNSSRGLPTELNIFIFRDNINNSGETTTFYCGKLYSYKLSDSNSTVRDFIPCILTSDIPDSKCANSSLAHTTGTVGLWDLVEDKFYANSGTGIFQYKEFPNYLCFTANEAGSTVALTQVGIVPDPELEISLDRNTWMSYIIGTIITLNNIDDSVYFRRQNDTPATSFNSTNSNQFNFVMTGSISASGNLMSLLDKSCASVTIPSAYCFIGLFNGCESLTNPPKLPATTLADNCYTELFYNCTSLTTTPELPATSLPSTCYSHMFDGCTNLISAPSVLSITNAGRSSCMNMFSRCTSLTTAPELPAVNLEDSCYSFMFQNCISLINPPSILPATTLANECYRYMFSGCSNLKLPPIISATTLATECCNSMFRGCTKLISLPQLKATTLILYCYINMFYDCSNLKISEVKTEKYSIPYRIPTEGTGIEATFWNSNMFKNTGGTFTGNPELNKTYYLYDYTFKPTIRIGTKALINSYVGLSGVKKIYLGTKLAWEKKEEEADYLCITPEKDAYIYLMTYDYYDPPNIEISSDKINWSRLPVFDMHPANQPVYFRHSLDTIQTFSTAGESYRFYVNNTDEPVNNVKFKASGNVMSLVDKTCKTKTIPGNYCFDSLFRQTFITEAPKLPATTITQSCYRYMFAGCRELITAPELPATEIADSCYVYMFQDCSKLLNAPSVLPATVAKSQCYCEMFENCTSLVRAPEIMANTLANQCFYIMFYGCTSLNYIKVHFTSWTGYTYPTGSWVGNVASSGNFYCPEELPTEIGNSGIPTGWNKNDKAPYTVGEETSTGFIFYDKGYYSDGWRFIECAKSALSDQYVWGDDGAELGLSRTVGNAKNNTTQISTNRSTSRPNNAANACINYKLSNYNWYLPTWDELIEVYNNITSKGIATYTSGGYWVSNEVKLSGEYSSTFGCSYYINNGTIEAYERAYTRNVLPIRYI